MLALARALKSCMLKTTDINARLTYYHPASPGKQQIAQFFVAKGGKASEEVMQTAVAAMPLLSALMLSDGVQGTLSGVCISAYRTHRSLIVKYHRQMEYF